MSDTATEGPSTGARSKPGSVGRSSTARSVRLNRRHLLRLSLLAAVGAVAGACAGPGAPKWTFAPPAKSAGLLIKIVAVDFAFDLAEFSVSAETPFRIEFDHRDVKIPHNVAIYASGPDGPALFRGEIFSGPKVVTYDVPGLPRGVHHFTCDPHPYMTGVVTVS
ncbi:MAG: cupredoxin domain-containing protein [Candidatus Limnocylindrales bacterium]